ncbi:TfoX/Sxy family protein [Luteimonas sp. e5]
MASDAGFVEYLSEQLALGERFSWRRMFGEYALYVDGKVVGFVCDNRILIKPNAAVARLHPQLPQQPPYPGAKDYPVADELLDDADALRRVFLESAAVLPAAKPKKPKPAPRRKRGDSG